MRVATVGDNCVDLYIESGKAYPGGNPVNVAVYMKRLGIESSYVGVVGNDEYGKIIREALADKGVNIDQVRVLSGKTAVTQVQMVDGDRKLGDYDEGVLADFKLNNEDISFLLQHNLIHSSIWGNIENDLYKLYKKGPLISFDFADKLQHETVAKALPYVDYAFFSYSADDKFIENYIIEAHKKGPRIVIATLGNQGSIAWDGHNIIRFGIIPVEPLDTLGAGDSYIAGFMKGVLTGESIIECMRFGAKSASQTIQYRGAW